MNRIRRCNIARLAQKGFSLPELIAVVSIIGIVSTLSIPSFVNWRRLEVINSVRDELLVGLSGIADESKKWGATCTVSIQMAAAGIDPLRADCRADGSLKSFEMCQRATGCNITNKQRLVESLPETQNGDDLVEVLFDRPNVAFTPRGQLATNSDAVFVIQGTPALGGAPAARCVVMKAITGELKDGEYMGLKPQPGTSSSGFSTALSASQCRIRV